MYICYYYSIDGEYVVVLNMESDFIFAVNECEWIIPGTMED